MSALLAAVGDVLVDRSAPNDALSGIAPLLRASDLSFGNFEGVLTDTHAAKPGAEATVVGIANAAPLDVFDVLSLANNHSVDAGAGGLADTINVLLAREIATVGAGVDLDAALATVVVERGGLSIAFIAVTSVFPVGSEASTQGAGVAPLRADDYFAPRSRVAYLPGVPPRVISVLDDRDRNALLATVGDACAGADIVIVSVHWGDHTQPWVLTAHERNCARLLVEAGASIVLGHHQHFFRGVEFINGRPIFYGLGHIVFDQPRYAEELRSRGIDIDHLGLRELVAHFGEYGIYPRHDSRDFPFHPLARRTGVALVELEASGAVRSGIVPCRIGRDNVARPVRRADSEWNDGVAFLRACLVKPGLDAELTDSGWVHAGHDVIEIHAGGATTF